MGWASGSDIACDVARSIKRHVKDAKRRQALYKDLVEALDSHDWDTHDEACGIDPLLDKILER